MINLLFLENNTDQDIIKQKLCRKTRFEYYIPFLGLQNARQQSGLIFPEFEIIRQTSLDLDLRSLSIQIPVLEEPVLECESLLFSLAPLFIIKVDVGSL